MSLLKKTKYLNFKEIGDTGKTKLIVVENTFGVKLGLIRWYGPWRKYCFIPSDGTTYDTSCLNDIIVFINELMDKRNGK
jgi:hypothetical protein